MKNRLFASSSTEDLIQLLQAWRFWLLAGGLGALLGWAAYLISPPDFRARATVLVDFNMEESWPVDSDRELFYYLEREARKLEEVAWSDDVLDAVADTVGGTTVDELRSGILELSEPADGGWHFYANDPDPARAEQLASAWAESFVAEVHTGIKTAVALDAARKALEANPTEAEILAYVTELESESLGITPELQVSASQVQNLNLARRVPLSTYVFAGAVSFMAVSALIILFFGLNRRA
ncbi:MAG TPA: hypothetical protein VK851_07560 [Anaerolineales bacterium]|nr:hypothetical protein [Anaerolineales bacterium]